MILKGCNLDELLDLIDENFYRKIQTKAEFIKFLESVYYSSCRQLGIEVNFSEFQVCPLPKNKYASISEYTYRTFVNQKYVDLFDICKQANNIYFPFRLSEACLHESRHIAQYKGDGDVGELLHYYAQFTKVFPKFITDISKKTSPLEVDARYYAYCQLIKHKFLQRYLGNSQYVIAEQNKLCEYASIYNALLKTQNASRFGINKPSESAEQLQNKLTFACTRLLSKYKIDEKDYSSAFYLLASRERTVSKMTRRPTELKIIETNTQPIEQNIKERLSSGEDFSQEELLKWKEKMLSLAVRPEIAEKAYYALELNSFRARETRALYSEYAPKFAEFDSTKTLPPPPDDEIQYLEILRGKVK